jgi:hypothetical protein
VKHVANFGTVCQTNNFATCFIARHKPLQNMQFKSVGLHTNAQFGHVFGCKAPSLVKQEAENPQCGVTTMIFARVKMISPTVQLDQAYCPSIILRLHTSINHHNNIIYMDFYRHHYNLIMRPRQATQHLPIGGISDTNMTKSDDFVLSISDLKVEPLDLEEEHQPTDAENHGSKEWFLP